jgi:hypothetical protein
VRGDGGGRTVVESDRSVVTLPRYEVKLKRTKKHYFKNKILIAWHIL